MKPNEIAQRFEQAGLPPPRAFDHETAEGSVRIQISGDIAAPAVVFAHGSPGSWDAFVDFMRDPKLAARFCLISVDRPGFGATLPDRAEPSIETQARRIHEAVAASGARLPAIWVGHSLGGPVVARIATDFPESVGGLALVAPSIDPELEKRRWYNYIAAFPPVNWALSRYWAHSNDEIYPLRRELLALEKRLPFLRAPTIVIHGAQDDLVDPKNADFVKARFVNAAVELRLLPDANHFIPWNRRDEIVAAIEGLAR